MTRVKWSPGTCCSGLSHLCVLTLNYSALRLGLTLKLAVNECPWPCGWKTNFWIGILSVPAIEDEPKSFGHSEGLLLIVCLEKREFILLYLFILPFTQLKQTPQQMASELYFLNYYHYFF